MAGYFGSNALQVSIDGGVVLGLKKLTSWKDMGGIWDKRDIHPLIMVLGLGWETKNNRLPRTYGRWGWEWNLMIYSTIG